MLSYYYSLSLKLVFTSPSLNGYLRCFYKLKHSNPNALTFLGRCGIRTFRKLREFQLIELTMNLKNRISNTILFNKELINQQYSCLSNKLCGQDIKKHMQEEAIYYTHKQQTTRVQPKSDTFIAHCFWKQKDRQILKLGRFSRSL